MVKILKFLIIFFLLLYLPFANANEVQNNDFLYSAEYFDYLIECAQYEANKKLDAQELEPVAFEVENNFDDEIIIEDNNIFKLHVAKDVQIKPYSETYKRENTKTTIPVSSKVSIFQNTTQFRNKYNSTDYRVLGGLEFNLHKYFDVQGGFETNYRGLDQNPRSRKLYITPQLNLSNRITLSFPNKIDVDSKTSDHDIKLSVSPFKSGAFDFSVYASLSREQQGQTSKSINFSTSFNF